MTTQPLVLWGFRRTTAGKVGTNCQTLILTRLVPPLISEGRIGLGHMNAMNSLIRIDPSSNWFGAQGPDLKLD